MFFYDKCQQRIRKRRPINTEGIEFGSKIKKQVMDKSVLIRCTLFIFLNWCIISQLTAQKKAYINDIDGYISFYVNYEEKPIDRLLKNLSKGKCDTCFIYTHLRFFSNNNIIVDSVSYDCLNNKVLSRKVLSKYERRYHIKVDTTEDVSIPFEPYTSVFQISMEVGKKKNNEKNRWVTGYTKNFNDFP